jgi:hypothetical protein
MAHGDLSNKETSDLKQVRVETDASVILDHGRCGRCASVTVSH